MEKRMIIAIALSLLILVLFQKLVPTRTPVTPEGVLSRQGNAATVETAQQAINNEVTKTPLSTSTEDKEPPYLQEKTEEIRIGFYRAIFSDKGGCLRSLSIADDATEGQEEILVNAKEDFLRPFMMQSAQIPELQEKIFKSKKTADGIEYVFQEPGKFEITKKYSFPNGLNYINLDITVKNISDGNLNFAYQMIGPSEMEKSGEIAGRSFLEADTLIDGKIWKVKNTKNVQEKSGEISWTALKNRYFALILKPFTPQRTVSVQSLSKKNLVTALNTRIYELTPGQGLQESYLFYAGPLEEKALADVGYDMEQIIDYGFFGSVSKVLLNIMGFFHHWTGNWGIAVILLTLTINVVLFPLTVKSFSSMQKMKEIQPHMQKLKEIHKDNPQKLNKEMMELYRKYNVNPLGGCLPMLLQMPIFIALYQGLMRSVALKGAHFLWIKDLAKPEGIPLPFTLPLIGASINILPLLMVGLMVIQQKISQVSTAAMSDEQASQQKMMAIMFPLFFGFLFYKMPSGLVLYWLTNTILMTAEQAVISRKMSR